MYYKMHLQTGKAKKDEIKQFTFVKDTFYDPNAQPIEMEQNKKKLDLFKFV